MHLATRLYCTCFSPSHTLHWQNESFRAEQDRQVIAAIMLDYSYAIAKDSLVYRVLPGSVQPTSSRPTMHEMNTPNEVGLAAWTCTRVNYSPLEACRSICPDYCYV
jgi:hypothetical protein